MPTPTKFGTEFLVNTITDGFQTEPSISGLADGRLVVVWTDYSLSAGNASMADIRAQVFNADGSKLGIEFLVNTTTSAPQDAPSVTALVNGNFLVVWEDSSMGGGSGDTAIRAQVISSSGSKVGSEFLVNTAVSSSLHDTPRATALADGRFVVTWSYFDFSDGDSIHAQMFNADGSKSGTEIVVNTTTSGRQSQPSITALTTGGFVVTWTDESRTGTDTSGGSIRGQVFNADSGRNGSEFLVNTTTSNDQIGPSIAALPSGHFVVTWTDTSAGLDVRAQVFNADGTQQGTEFIVNTTSSSDQVAPSIAALKDGRFAVAWTDLSESGEDISGYAVRAQVFNTDGNKSGTEFLVNTTTAGYQVQPSIAALADGRFAVTWRDDSQADDDTSAAAVRAQIFDPRQPGITLIGTDLGDDWVGTSDIDTMQGLQGQDHLDGSDGIGDTASYAEKTTAVVATLAGAAWADVSVGEVVEDRIRNFEDLTGGSASDKLTGDSFDNTFVGGAGNDVLVTLDGFDRALGDAGNDYLYMGEGSDFADGGSGVDVLVLAGGNDFGHGGADQDYLFGGLGDDWLWGEDGVDVLHGEDGNDFIQGGVGNDYYYGGLGDDIAFEDTGLGNIDSDIFVMGAGADSAAGGLGQDYFYMGDGNYEAYGGDGVDVFLGEAGNDLFDGGSGVDYAWGGLGNDTYLARSDSGVLVVQDFAAGGTDDALRLFPDTGITTLSGVLAASTYYAGMNTTIITIDADTAVWLVGINKTQLTNADFVFNP